MSRRGFTLIELLVVIAIIAVLLALLVPAVQKVRESSNRLQCSNKLKQIGLALHNYVGATGAFPPAHVQLSTTYPCPKPPDQKAYFSWMTRILPYLEQQAIYDRVNWTSSPWWQHSINETFLPIFACSSDPRPSYVINYGGDLVALSGYMGVSGTDQLAFDGVLPVIGHVTLRKITDGTSNTLLVGERPPSFDQVYGWWFAGAGQAPYYFGATDVVLGTNEITASGTRDVFRAGLLVDPLDASRWHFWSLHSGGSNFLFADGSVHYVAYDIGQSTFAALGTRAGEETISRAFD